MPPGMRYLLILRRSFGADPLLQRRSSRMTRQTSNKNRTFLLFEYDEKKKHREIDDKHSWVTTHLY